MRLAAIIIENDDQPMLSACSIHKALLDEWAWAVREKGEHTVSEGVTFGDCKAGQGPHEEYTEDR